MSSEIASKVGKAVGETKDGATGEHSAAEDVEAVGECSIGCAMPLLLMSKGVAVIVLAASIVAGNETWSGALESQLRAPATSIDRAAVVQSRLSLQSYKGQPIARLPSRFCPLNQHLARFTRFSLDAEQLLFRLCVLAVTQLRDFAVYREPSNSSPARPRGPTSQQRLRGICHTRQADI